MKPSLRLNNSGVAALEFALILPVLVLLLLGVLEFGVYFVKSQFVQRTVSGIANSVQLNAQDSTNIHDTAMNSGGSMITYNDTQTAYFCAKAYVDLASAQAGMCNPTEWFLDKPPGVTGTIYYVAIQASVQQNSITAMFANLLPPMKATAVVQVGAAAPPASAAWVDAPPGAMFNYCYQPSPFYMPSEWCVRKGYTAATGAFKNGDGSFEGTIAAIKGASPHWCGDYGGNVYMFDSTYKILCVK